MQVLMRLIIGDNGLVVGGPVVWDYEFLYTVSEAALLRSELPSIKIIGLVSPVLWMSDVDM